MSPDEERREGAEEGAEGESQGRPGGIDQPTEESFALEGELNDEGEPGTDEFFEGIPPEQLDSPGEHPPELEPEFQQALREAAGAPIDSGAGQGPDTVEYKIPAEDDAAAEPAPDEPAPDEPAADEPHEDEPAPAPAKPVRHVVIGAGSPPPAPAEAPAADPGAEGAEAEQTSSQEGQTDADETKVQEPAAVAAATAAPPAKPPLKPPLLKAGTPGAPQRPGPMGDPEPAPRRPRLWLRFLIATLVIISSCAGATAAAGILFFDDIASKLHGIPGVQSQLLPPQGGEPENILIIGSDKRAGAQGGLTGLSDTTILLRLDPNRKTIALMSIPRDLKTYLGPNLGTGKFNAAYAYGGAQKTLRVVRRLTGLSINHIVNVDFLGFVRAVDAIGCVWVQVDRRYYHSNAGLPPSLQYSEINIQPGYQKLCGKDALAYVRYRHTDTDLVRSARQQDFLREARAQVPATKLFFDDRNQLLDIFTTYTTSDINSADELLGVLKLFVASRGARIEEVHFPGILHPSYVTASKSSIATAVAKFRGSQASGGPRGALETPTNKTGIGPEDKKFKNKHPAPSPSQPQAPKTPTPANDGLVDASIGSHQVASPIAKKVGPGFPVFYPRRLPSGAVYVSAQNYHLRDLDKNRHQGYVEVLQLPQGDYFGVQGVAGWSDPPILKSPSETRTINGRDYDIYLDGDRVRMVAWHDGDNSYWVYNSLLQTLTGDQMLGIARSIGEIKPPPQKRGKP